MICVSEVDKETGGVIITKDLMDFLDRNDFNSIVRTETGLEFIQKNKNKYNSEDLKLLLTKALNRIDDETCLSREARAIIKQVRRQL